MIGFHVIVAVLLIHSRSTNANEFSIDLFKIRDHLRSENFSLESVNKTIGEVSTLGGHEDILCDKLNNDEKLLLCEKMRLHLVLEEIGFVYTDYGYADSSLPKPEIVGSGDPYKCQQITIEKVEMEKRMFWCESKQFRGGATLEYQEMEGFFLASGQENGRVYAFRPSIQDSKKVSPEAEMNDVDLILKHVPGSLNEDFDLSTASIPSEEIVLQNE